MKAADVVVGGEYLAQVEFKFEKVTVLDVPVVRMVPLNYARRDGQMRPYRRDGRADGARVRVERTGKMVDIALVKVEAPWGAADDEREARRSDCIARVAAARAKLATLGLPNEDTWRGQAASVDVCEVKLPFVEFEAWLTRVEEAMSR